MGGQGLEVRAMRCPGQLLRVQCHRWVCPPCYLGAASFSQIWALQTANTALPCVLRRTKHTDFGKSYMDFDGGVGRAPR